MGREVGGDDPVHSDQPRYHPHPLAGELARAMQKDDRPPIAALEDGGLDAGQGQPPLGGGNPSEQPIARIALRARIQRCASILALGRDSRLRCVAVSSCFWWLRARRYELADPQPHR